MRPVASLFLLAGCAAPRSQGIEWPESLRLTQLDVTFGVRSLASDLEPNDDALGVGIDWQEGDAFGPLALEGGLHFAWDRASTATGVDHELDMVEGSVGLRWEPGRPDAVRPFLGGGGSLLWLDRRVDDGLVPLDDEDVVFGGYLKAGLLVPLRSGGHVGLEARWLDVRAASLGGASFDADGLTFALVAGASY